LIGNTELNQYHHKKIERVIKRLSQDESEGTFIIALRSGDWIETAKIPRPQLERLDQIARDFLEHQDQEEPADQSNG